MIIFRKLILARQNLSFFEFFVFVLTYPERFIKTWFINRKMRAMQDLEERFTLIHNENLWRSRESKSGSGSSLKMTENLRSHLPIILDKFKINTIFDAPCGDFNWMREVDLTKVDYTGGDIVKSMIEDLNLNFRNKNLKFVHIDLTKEPFPKSDLVITRDCLFHLSYEDIQLVLKNFIESESKYLLTTTYQNIIGFENKNIISGDFRLFDLMGKPFRFPSESLYIVEENGEWALPQRYLILWSREQVVKGHANLVAYLSNPQKV